MMWTSPSCLIIRGMRSSIIMLDFSTPLFQLALFSQVSFMIIHSTTTAMYFQLHMVIFVIWLLYNSKQGSHLYYL